jgi:hypothetical protein
MDEIFAAWVHFPSLQARKIALLKYIALWLRNRKPYSMA